MRCGCGAKQHTLTFLSLDSFLPFLEFVTCFFFFPPNCSSVYISVTSSSSKTFQQDPSQYYFLCDSANQAAYHFPFVPSWIWTPGDVCPLDPLRTSAVLPFATILRAPHFSVVVRSLFARCRIIFFLRLLSHFAGTRPSVAS